MVAEDPARPFFAYIAPKAAHEPFNPAPWYEGHWDASWPDHEPRPENWNCTADVRQNHIATVAQIDMITEEASLTTLSHRTRPTENLLQDTDAVACYSLLLLRCVLLMTSSHF